MSMHFLKGRGAGIGAATRAARTVGRLVCVDCGPGAVALHADGRCSRCFDLEAVRVEVARVGAELVRVKSPRQMERARAASRRQQERAAG
jgi:hypothetical protein